MGHKLPITVLKKLDVYPICLRFFALFSAIYAPHLFPGYLRCEVLATQNQQKKSTKNNKSNQGDKLKPIAYNYNH